MTDFSYIRADGEHIKDLDSVHVPHPDAPPVFGRSTLVVGSRGVGKTVLLRVRKKHTHPGAVYVNLLKALQSITREAGLGGRDLAFDELSSRQIQAKTAAILAIAIIETLAKDEDAFRKQPLAIVRPLLPEGLIQVSQAEADDVKSLKYKISGWPLDQWRPLPALEMLSDVIMDIDDRRELETMLFLDRAEDAPKPSAQLLMGLLDQTFGLVTVIATRPGLTEQLSREFDPTLVPGDHYALIHLGTQPYSPPWLDFAAEAVSRYIKINTASDVQENDILWAVRMGRDSLRRMIELAWIGRETATDVSLRADKVQQLKSLAQSSAQARMRPFSYDFIEAMESINKEITKKLEERSSQCALVWSVPWAKDQDGTRASEVLRRALSHELLLFPEGISWNPFELPTEVEVPPLFLWNRGLQEWIR